MSAPTPHPAGLTCFITRRTQQGEFLLKPSAAVALAFVYNLAWGQHAYGVAVHAASVASNHYHAGCTDTRDKSRLSLFTALVHKLFAKCVNSLWNRKGSVFCSSSGCRTQVLPRPEDVLDRLAYIVAQPVRHALVENREEWPGFQLTIEQMAGAEIKVRRPAFFSKHMPDELTLTITRPPHFQHLSAEEYTAVLRTAVEAEEAKWREHNAKEGISYGTRESALAVAHTDRPTRRSLKERYAKRPKFATTCPEVRKNFTTYLHCFNRSYTEARLDYAAGNQTRLFPPGTHQLQQILSLPCHPADPAGHWPMTRPPPLPTKVE